MTAYVTFLDYPIYSIAQNANCLVTSGGGGGKNYGIEDLLVNLWAGCLSNNIIFFYFHDERGFVLLHKIPVKHNKKSSRQVVLRFCPSGENLIVGGDDAILKVWKINIEQYPHKENTTGKTCKFQGSFSPAKLFDDNPVEFITDLVGHEGEIKDCSISFDSRLAASCGADLTLRIWNLERSFLLHTQNYPNPTNKQRSLFFRCCRKVIDLGESAKCEILKIIKIDQSACCSLAVRLHMNEIAYSENENFFAIGFVSGEVKLLDNRLRLKLRHSSHGLPVTGLCFMNSDSVLVSSGADYSVAKRIKCHIPLAPEFFISKIIVYKEIWKHDYNSS
ncbi:WD domain, G-beta repeat-containing protein [Cardiosporidium cionae]|uniref:WD domain, G-beta repeat-containing protein n=1 Tax=Cardiosporidium cionae TaxID=476202 RepID=A0ABQ7JFV2_9APIC|nr:WD domain, G-beta repeat-containing protein [Cardiosporidium cionae]|eukprot:KAF8822844.1 WD domain, G-beta repeat-containing protein [Cardiosporidium cionae]